MASHPDRLKMSACYQESHANPDSYDAMTCITCHDVHVSIETLGPAFYNDTCQSCHTPAQQNLCTEEQSARAAINDNCIGCHMPISGSEDIPHVRVTDHFIRTPDSKEESILSTEEMQEQKQFVGMASLVESSPSARDIAESYLTYYEEVTNLISFTSWLYRFGSGIPGNCPAGIFPARCSRLMDLVLVLGARLSGDY